MVKRANIKKETAKEVIMKPTKKDLVDFGNYLLSRERYKTLINKENENKVTHADIENWLYKREER